MSCVSSVEGAWSSNMAPTGSSWPVPASLNAATRSRTLKKRESPVPGAEKKWSLKRRKREESFTAARAIRSAILSPGRSRPERNVRNAEAIWLKRETSWHAPMNSAVL